MTIRLTVETPARHHCEHVTIPGFDAVISRDGDELIIDTGIQVQRIKFASISAFVSVLDVEATIRANTTGPGPLDLVLRRDPHVNGGNDFWTWPPPASLADLQQLADRDAEKANGRTTPT